MSQDPTTSDSEQDDFDKAFEVQAVRIAGEAPPAWKSDESDDDDASEGGEAEVAADKGQAAAATDDPMKDAPDSIKQLFAAEKAARLAAEHSARSNAGRVSALQRKLDEGKGTPRSDNAGGSDAPGAESGNDDGDSFGRDYPEVSDFVTRRVKQLIEPVVAKAGVEEAEQQQVAETARVAKAFATIAAAHPDFDEIRHDPAYGVWLDQQPHEVRLMAGSEDPASAIALCDLYKAKGKQGSVRNSRQQLIADAEEIPSQGGSRRNGVPDDFDAAFEHYANQSKTKR